MPVKNDREYRSMPMMEFREEESTIVEGYASTFEPYELYSDGTDTIYERIEPTAFDGCDMSDVLFLYNHSGRVMARQKNGTLKLSVDAHGLKVEADLGKTSEGRAMLEEIRTGMVDQMSFAFTVADEHYERSEHTRVITKFRKLYDVSAVSVPANPTTEISARDYFNGVIEAERLERAEAEKRAEKIRKIKLMMEMHKHDA